MESLQLIKNRINSIASTRQITQSMRLVSTAKVQKARARMQANAPFLEESERLMRAMAAMLPASHPLVKEREAASTALVVISGDRGLCGGYNVGVCREADARIASLGEVRIVSVGVKARDYCRRRYKERLERSFIGVSETPFYDDAIEIAETLLAWYRAGEIDAVEVLYTRFQSMLVHHPKRVRLLPIPPPGADADRLVRCEPGQDAFLARMLPFYIASFLYGAMLESSSCEQSARIASMDAAVKNADEMIESLTLRYNQARQGAITQEITEIVGGADAVV